MKLKILHDETCEGPREWGNLGVMACWHRRSNLGDVQPKCSPDEWLKDNAPEGSVVLPLYLYEHSGMTMSTSNSGYPFTDPWDSGQVGWIVATPEAIRKNYDVKRVTKEVREKVEAALRSEVKVYDMWLQGNVWGFVFTKLWCDHPRHEKPCDAECELCQRECGPANYREEQDSCWGFYGEDLKEAGIEEALPEEAKPLLQAAWEARS